MRWIIEVRDTRDAHTSEPWSHFGIATNQMELRDQLDQLRQYLYDYPTVVETRIRKEN
jgi:hypothetical protein